MKQYLFLEWKKWRKNELFFFSIIVVGLLYAYAFQHRYTTVIEQQAKIDTLRADAEKKIALYRTLMDSAVSGTRQFPGFQTDPRNPAQLTRAVPRYAFMEQTAYSILATGQSDLFSQELTLNIWNKDPRLASSDIKNPVQRMFGQLDPATVLILLLPLLISAFTYNIISGEREGGTFKIGSVQAGSLRQWLMAKMLVPAMVLAGFFFLETIVLLAIYANGWALMPLHLLAFALLLLLYISFWCGLALLINLYNTSSAVNIVLMLGSWLFAAFILPSLFNLLALQVFNVPSRVSFVNTYRNTYSEVERSDRQKVLDKYFFDHPELVKPDTSQKRYAVNELAKASAIFYEHVHEKAEPVYADYFRRQRSADQFAEVASFFSPVTLFQYGLNEISNTSQEQFLAFQDSAIHFRNNYLKKIKAKLVQDEELTISDIDKLPEFKLDAATLSIRAWRAIILLMAQCLLIFLVMQKRLRKPIYG